MRLCRQFILALALTVAGASAALAEEVLIAAASSMSFPIEEIIDVFERTTPHTVRLTLGSSGNFQSQILNGAPFDVYMSADMDYVRRLENSGVVEPGTLSVYAVGKIVVWIRSDSTLDVNTLGMNALLDSEVERVSIANPQHAPYGRAAIQAMESAGVLEGVRSKLVMGENVSQAAQFVQSGTVQIGILPMSIATADPMGDGRYWEIPIDTYARIEQGMAILTAARRSGHDEAARAFLETVRSPAGRAILLRYGFLVP